jgi:hypothetical protein
MNRIGVGTSLLAVLACLLACAWAEPARAIRIEAAIDPLGGASYRAVYSVHNDGSLGAGTPVLLFDVLFDPALYREASLQIVTPIPLSSAWSELLLASAPGLAAAYDALALGAGIADGETAAGFAVEFEWLGVGAPPGSQPFVVYDATTFAVLEEGATLVPEAGLPSVLALALAGLALRRGRR